MWLFSRAKIPTWAGTGYIHVVHLMDVAGKRNEFLREIIFFPVSLELLFVTHWWKQVREKSSGEKSDGGRKIAFDRKICLQFKHICQREGSKLFFFLKIKPSQTAGVNFSWELPGFFSKERSSFLWGKENPKLGIFWPAVSSLVAGQPPSLHWKLPAFLG